MKWPDDYLIPGIKPFYQEEAGIIYCGKSEELLKRIPDLITKGVMYKCPVDLMLTDPPYPEFNQDHGKIWSFVTIDMFYDINCQQYIFWPATKKFQLNYSAVHIWHKPNSASNEEYELIYERNGSKKYRVFRVRAIMSSVAAQMNYDVYTKHPAQKPIKLIRDLIKLTQANIILDPFLGSGTTAVAAKELGRKFIGIEISEEYCKIAVKRLRQGVLDFG